jgi:hypothetical protein
MLGIRLQNARCKTSARTAETSRVLELEGPVLDGIGPLLCQRTVGLERTRRKCWFVCVPARNVSAGILQPCLIPILRLRSDSRSTFEHRHIAGVKSPTDRKWSKW